MEHDGASRGNLHLEFANQVVDFINRVDLLVNSAVPAALFFLCAQHHHSLRSCSALNPVVFKTFGGVPVEYEEERPSLVDHDFVWLADLSDVLVL